MAPDNVRWCCGTAVFLGDLVRYSLAFLALVFLASCGGSGGSGSGGGAPAPSANRAPQFTSATSVSIVENSVAAYQATASDPDGNSLVFSISGGADAARFAITPTGALTFVAAPDFDLPGDADGDNVYVVQVTVSDGALAATQTVQITVTNSREGIQVRRIASGLNQPLYVAPIPGDTRVWVLEKTGRIMILDPATGAMMPFMTVGANASAALGALSTDGERGLLGMVAAPNYQTSGVFYVYVTVANGDIEVRRYVRGFDGLGSPQSGQRTLSIPHSQFNNHYGGWIAFGPDGYIYISTGDGGGAGDPLNNAQNTNSLLGKILRVASNPDPFAGTSPNYGFVAAPGNPFIGGGGDPRVFAYGFRNPFRASFFNGDLLIGDVGQDTVEEIDRLRPQDIGGNFGWPFREGTRGFQGTPPAGLIDPVSQFFHGTGPRVGNSIIGGYVYRGPVASLAGQYVFGDYITGNLWTVPVAQLQSGQTLPSSAYARRNEDFTPDVGTINQIVSFGEDSAGNLYIVDFDGEVFIVGGS